MGSQAPSLCSQATWRAIRCQVPARARPVTPEQRRLRRDATLDKRPERRLHSGSCVASCTQAASNTRSLWRAGPVARCSFAPLPHAEATRFADRVVRMRRTAKPLLHRLTVHFSNKFVRAQVAARNSGDVVCHAHTSEAALRESWESTSDRHAARRIGTSPPAAAAPAAPAPAPALGCPRRAAPLLTNGARRMQASSWASAS